MKQEKSKVVYMKAMMVVIMVIIMNPLKDLVQQGCQGGFRFVPQGTTLWGGDF